MTEQNVQIKRKLSSSYVQYFETQVQKYIQYT